MQSNILEYLAGTDPTDPAKSFSLQSPSLVDGQFSFTFEALPDRIYQLESASPKPIPGLQKLPRSKKECIRIPYPSAVPVLNSTGLASNN